ncbi:MAG: hypothetical protein KAX66_01100 [Propionivibrio sp.]|nr:hypothetical protein [Propionivibrio sp.]
MKPLARFLPAVVVVGATTAALWQGPIAQLPDYHHFADDTIRFGVPHFADVISNIGFALVALATWVGLAGSRDTSRLGGGWPGYRLFLVSLFLTAFGSAWYHLAPDNARLVWDRLPIALACAGLLAGVWGDTRGRDSGGLTNGLAAFAIFSVAWWYGTDLVAVGDLRPYLLLQAAPIILVPLWQWVYDSERADRVAFGMALLLYVAAKFAELYDHEIGAVFGTLTGHTLKHLLATGAAALIAARLLVRVRSSSPAFENGAIAARASR